MNTRIFKTISFGVAAMALMAVLVSAYPASSKAQFSNNARNLAGLIAVDDISDDGSFSDGDSDLADLIVLGGLFPTSSNANTNAKDLAGLIAVDNILGDGGSFSDGDDDLASLLVLNNLFLDP